MRAHVYVIAAAERTPMYNNNIRPRQSCQSGRGRAGNLLRTVQWAQVTAVRVYVYNTLTNLKRNWKIS